MLRLVLGVGRLASPLARPLLKKRLARGKEDPVRWCEKLGQATMARPDGPLVWLHGVGVGEVMALRGLIERLSSERPELQFLVTSSARSSGDVFAKNLPANTCHQYLPLDLPAAVAAFLDHWKPDLAVWSDQEIWPRMAVSVAKRAIPQAYVAARITEKSARAKAKFGSAYGDLYRLLDLRHAQDATTSAALQSLMGEETPVQISGSIKAAAPPLTCDPDVRAAFTAIASTRMTWVLAPSHPADEALALAAHKQLRYTVPDALLIIAPRTVARALDVGVKAREIGLTACTRSQVAHPNSDTSVYVADSYGELGTWYGAAPVALIGGTFDAIEGHNPWEAVALDCAVLHGPRVANFSSTYKMLGDNSAARLVQGVDDIVAALRDPDLQGMAQRATALRTSATLGLDQICADLLGLLDR